MPMAVLVAAGGVAPGGERPGSDRFRQAGHPALPLALPTSRRW
jgi:hypothetical protein